MFKQVSRVCWTPVSALTDDQPYRFKCCLCGVISYADIDNELSAPNSDRRRQRAQIDPIGALFGDEPAYHYHHALQKRNADIAAVRIRIEIEVPNRNSLFGPMVNRVSSCIVIPA